MTRTCEFCGDEFDHLDVKHLTGECCAIKKFVSLKELDGGVGFALQTLPKTTLMSWGFDIEGEITVWDDWDGRWFWQRKPNVVKA